MGSRERIAVFLSDFDLQVNEIEKVYERLEKKSSLLQSSSPTSEVVESAGYWLHNLYNALEDLFQLIAGFWENTLDDRGLYHRSLLRRMRLEIEGIRPALLREEMFQHIDELRGFRHVFRHAYSYGLDDKRVQLLLGRVLRNKEGLMNDLQLFRSRIQELRDAPEE